MFQQNLKKISLPKGVKEWFDENNVSFQTNSTNIRTKDLLKNKNVTLKQCESWLDVHFFCLVSSNNELFMKNVSFFFC